VSTPAPAELNERLRAAGQQADADFDVLDTALTLAALDRPRVPLERYRAHLQTLAAELSGCVAADADADVDAAAAALRQVLVEQHGYQGDELTYDDMQNANLMRVIDRRRGLPVALGILYIGTARACDWHLCGIRFPGHFLLRLELAGARCIIDPFGSGQVLDAGAMRRLLKRVAGDSAELGRQHFAPAGPREVLLRLQNNIRTRAVQAGELARAEQVLRRMLLIAPEAAELHRDHAVLLASQDQYQAARRAGEHYRRLAAPGRQRQDAEQLLARLSRRLN